jgi:predicted nucleotidyltransferase
MSFRRKGPPPFPRAERARCAAAAAVTDLLDHPDLCPAILQTADPLAVVAPGVPDLATLLLRCWLPWSRAYGVDFEDSADMREMVRLLQGAHQRFRDDPAWRNPARHLELLALINRDYDDRVTDRDYIIEGQRRGLQIAAKIGLAVALAVKLPPKQMRP